VHTDKNAFGKGRIAPIIWKNLESVILGRIIQKLGIVKARRGHVNAANAHSDSN
jgi:hypothetical protein